MTTLTPRQLEQYQAATEAVGLADWPGPTLLELTGADRSEWLHNLCTNDILRLIPGQGCEAFACTAQGKILAHLLVFCQSSSLVLATVPGQGERLAAHFDRYIIREDVQLVDRSSDWVSWMLVGPDAVNLLEQGRRSVPTHYLQHQSGFWESPELVVRRVGWAGADSFLVQCPAEAVVDWRQRLVDGGATVCQPEVMETLRIEHGFPWYGTDITEENLPQEVGRDERAISFSKGCYLGQETVARIDALGHVNWRLGRVLCDCDHIPAAATAALADGERVVGHITSAAWSPRFHRPLAWALLRERFTSPGTELTVAGEAAHVVGLPPAADVSGN